MNISSKAELDAAILELEKRKLMQEEFLIAQFKATGKSLHPLNLIKDSFNRLTETTSIQENLLKTVLGVGVAFLSKRLLIGRSSSLLKKALGTVVEFAVAKSTIDHADKIKAYAVSVYNTLFKKNHKQEHVNNQ